MLDVTQPPRPGPAQRVSVPTLSPSSAMHRQLVAQLKSARDGAEEPELREALDDVLAGRVDLRSAFRTGPLAALMASAGRRMRDEISALSPDERAELRSRLQQEGGEHA